MQRPPPFSLLPPFDSHQSILSFLPVASPSLSLSLSLSLPLSSFVCSIIPRTSLPILSASVIFSCARRAGRQGGHRRRRPSPPSVRPSRQWSKLFCCCCPSDILQTITKATSLDLRWRDGRGRADADGRMDGGGGGGDEYAVRGQLRSPDWDIE